jgi:hypothetical protein
MAAAPSTLEYCNDRRASVVAHRNTDSPDDPAVNHISLQFQMTEYGSFAIETCSPPLDEHHPSQNDDHQPQDETPKRTKNRRPSLSIRFGSFGWPHISITRRSSVISAPDSPSESEIRSPPIPRSRMTTKDEPSRTWVFPIIACQFSKPMNRALLSISPSEQVTPVSEEDATVRTLISLQ